jgi:predicted nucleic acid-binding protein
MAGPVVVPDASVLLKWVLRSPDEEDRSPALALKAAWLDEAVDIVVPTLWVFDVGNVLGLKQPSTATALLLAMVDLGLPERPASSYVSRIFDVMRGYGVTFYDAAYHALAIDRGGTMLTADRRYHRKCVGAGHLALIGDWRE